MFSLYHQKVVLGCRILRLVKISIRDTDPLEHGIEGLPTRKSEMCDG